METCKARICISNPELNIKPMCLYEKQCLLYEKQ